MATQSSKTPRSTAAVPTLVLLAVTAVWGSTFFMIKGILDELPPLDFLGLRFAIAALVVVVAFRRRLLRASRGTWVRGLVLGALYTSAQIAQTVGLEHTHASVSGFITGTCVVLTPVLMVVLFRQRLSWTVWGSVAVATVGLMVLSLRGWAFGAGEALTLLGAFLYALHIVTLGQWVGRDNPLTLASVQLVAIGVFSLVGAAPGGIVVPSGWQQWIVIVYTALAAGLLAMVAQTWAQSRLPATTAALVFTLEPVFAAVFAVLFGGESPTPRLLVGGFLVLAATIGVEVVPRIAGRRSSSRVGSDAPTPGGARSVDTAPAVPAGGRDPSSCS